MKTLNTIIATMFAVNAFAADCILQEHTTSQTTATVSERSAIRTAVAPFANGQKKCFVNYRAKVDGNWYEAMGEYVWDGSNSSTEACAAAVKQADQQLIQRIKPVGVISEQVLMCNDNPDTKQLQESNVGTIVDISRLRTHPEHPLDFNHNGTTCRWFVDPKFDNGNIHNYQGIACKISEGRWSVVDKF